MSESIQIWQKQIQCLKISDWFGFLRKETQPLLTSAKYGTAHTHSGHQKQGEDATFLLSWTYSKELRVFHYTITSVKRFITLSSFLVLFGRSSVIIVKSVPTWLSALKNRLVSEHGKRKIIIKLLHTLHHWPLAVLKFIEETNNELNAAINTKIGVGIDTPRLHRTT